MLSFIPSLVLGLLVWLLYRYQQKRTPLGLTFGKVMCYMWGGIAIIMFGWACYGVLTLIFTGPLPE